MEVKEKIAVEKNSTIIGKCGEIELIKAQSVYNSIRQSNQLHFMSKQNQTVS